MAQMTDAGLPINWPGSGRWTMDRGAVPGEPFAYLDGDEDSASASMIEIQTPGRPSTYEVRKPGGIVVTRAAFPELAAQTAERKIGLGHKGLSLTNALSSGEIVPVAETNAEKVMSSNVCVTIGP